jgi:hypothetical protein
MGVQVVMGAMMQCSFGVAPSSLVVLPQNKVLSMVPAANILDNKPIVNIPPFGMCSSPSNPTVAAATATALGVLTPMPCVPVTVAPWAPGSTKVTIGKMPALDSNCKLMCSWGGVIQIVSPGQAKVIDA